MSSNKSLQSASLIYGLLSAFCTLFYIVCLSVDGWLTSTSDDSTKHIGLFVENGNHQAYCNTNYSEAECGYLKASKASGILACILSFFCVYCYVRFVYKTTWGYFREMGACIYIICMGLQALFSLICIVYFVYLKNSHYTYDDDVNVEPDNSVIITTKYAWAFGFMCFLTALTSIQFLASFNIFIYNGNGLYLPVNDHRG